MKQIYDERRRYMISRLREMGFEIKVEPQGAFYIFADARKFTTDSYRFASMFSKMRMSASLPV